MITTTSSFATGDDEEDDETAAVGNVKAAFSMAEPASLRACSGPSFLHVVRTSTRRAAVFESCVRLMLQECHDRVTSAGLVLK